MLTHKAGALIARGRDLALSLPRPSWPFRRRPDPAPVLGGYTYHGRGRQRLKRLILFALGFFCFIWGALFALLPPSFLVMLTIPIAIVALFVIWALPDTETPMMGAVEWFLWAGLYTLLLWPNYLAIALPGLPWITAERLAAFPMTLLFLISLAVSPTLRRQMRAILGHSRWITISVIAFLGAFGLSIFFSKTPSASFNAYVSMFTSLGVVFFISAYVFSLPGRIPKWAWIVTLCVVWLCLLGLIEYRESRVLWANSIPSFLKVPDEGVQRVLSGAARYMGEYRVQSIFTVSLVFAELLGLTTVLFIHHMMTARYLAIRVLAGATIPLILFLIIRTDSRLGNVAFFGSFIGYFLFWGIKRWRRSHEDLIGPAVTLAYPIFIAGFFALSLVWNRLRVMTWGGGQHQSSNDARELQWELMWPKLFEWPFGYGVGRAPDTLGVVEEFGFATIDAYPINLLIDSGVIGFFGFVMAILIASYQGAVMGLREEPDEASWMLPAGVMLANFLIVKLVLSQTDIHGLIFLIIGMIVGMRYRLHQQDQAALAAAAPPASATAERPRWKRAAGVVASQA